MRRLPVCFLIASMILFLSFQTAGAQAGFFQSAQVLEKESMRVGAELIVGSIGFMGHVRYGAGDLFDIAVKTGVLSDSDITRFQIGFDGRYAYMKESAGEPADVNFTGLFHLSTGEGVTFWSIGVGPQVGKIVPFSNSDVTMAPYAGVLLGAIHTDFNISDADADLIEQLTGERPDTGDTSFGVLIPIGADVQMTPELAFFGEIDISIDGETDATVALGINYNYR